MRVCRKRKGKNRDSFQYNFKFQWLMAVIRDFIGIWKRIIGYACDACIWVCRHLKLTQRKCCSNQQIKKYRHIVVGRSRDQNKRTLQFLLVNYFSVEISSSLKSKQESVSLLHKLTIFQQKLVLHKLSYSLRFHV